MIGKSQKVRTRSPDTSRVNTLGSQARTLNELLDEMDRETDGHPSKRSFARSPFRAQAITTTVQQPDGSEVQLRLACRNLSVGGVSLLHSAYLHPGTRVSVELPHATGGTSRIKGKVVRCVHVRGMVHEVGVQFNELINLRDYQHADPFRMVFSHENIKPEQLKGLVVHLDPSEIDRKIVRHLLRDTSLSIRGCETASEARTLIESGCDLIMMEFGLSDSNGAILTSELRCEGHMQPVIMLSSSTSTEAEEVIRRAAVEVFLPKPVEARQLMSAIAEFLIPMGGESVVRKSDTEAMRDLVSLFGKELASYADHLEAALQQGNDKAVMQAAQQIRGTALSLGMKSLGTLAGDLTDRLGSKQPLAMLTRHVRRLVTACRSPQSVS